MSYPRRKDELVEVARAQMALLIQHAITTSERADKMTVERLEHWVRLVGRVTAYWLGPRAA